MLSQHLIERALSLTGKTMEDMKELVDCGNDICANVISFPRFCYYLLSPEFIHNLHNSLYIEEDDREEGEMVYAIGEAIYDYQSGNEEPLTILLSKI